MNQIVYLKYGELTLKGKNRINFINQLFKNIKFALRDFEYEIIKSFDSIIIQNFNATSIENIIDILKFVPGIFQIIKAYETKNRDIKLLTQDVINITKKINWETFKIKTKRHDKKYPINSMEFSKLLGAEILKNLSNKKVDIHKPDILINFEIKNDKIIFYFEKIKSVGGLPIGSSGKCLLLISGGIDSPVAAKLLMKKGMQVDFLTFITPPHTSDQALEKVKKLIKKITLDNKLEKSKFFICNFTHIQQELSHISDKSYQITLMRRYFFRIADHLRQTYKYDAIATGESLGQVASQTIQSMQTISQVLNSSCVVLRPLLTFDKLETISIAKQIGTYDISILPYEDCCALFVPKSPVTKPNINYAIKLETELELVNKIFEHTLMKYIKILD